MVVFEKCDNSARPDYCKSDEEIHKWLQFKYIVLLENEKKFIQHEFEFSKRIKAESTIKWFSLSD